MADDSHDSPANAAEAYEKLARDFREGILPTPKPICMHCTVLGVPFSINGEAAPRGADELLSIPSTPGAATSEWFTANPWIKDQAQNFRDTFHLRVIQELTRLHDEVYLAKLYAFLAAKRYQFVCLDDEIEEAPYVTPLVWAEITQHAPV